MYAYSSRRTSLHADDIAAARALYGPRSGLRPTPFPKWPNSVDLGNLTDFSGIGTWMGELNRPRNETDNYRFTLTERRELRIELRGLSGPADLFLTSAAGRWLAASQRSGTTDESFVQWLDPGTYYVTVKTVSIGAGTGANYQLRYSVEGAPDGRTFETAFRLGDLTNASTTAFLSRTETVNRASNGNDFYRFTLTGTRQMRFALTGLSGDAHLYLENASGQAIRNSRLAGISNELIVHTLGPGTWYLRVNANAFGTIRYSLQYRREPAPAQGTTRATAYNLGDLTGASTTTFQSRTETVNRTSNGNDFYRFTLTGTRQMRFALTGLSGDAHLHLENASGQAIRNSRLAGISNELIVHTLGPGTWYLRVNANAFGTIRYSLQYRREPAPAQGTTRATAYNLGDLTGASTTTFQSRTETVNRTSNGNDFYRFTLTGTRRMRFALTGLSGDAHLHLENASGQAIRNSRLAGISNELIVHTLGPGTWYLRVNANAFGTIRYQLRFRREATSAAAGSTRETAWNVGDLALVSTYRTRSGTVNRSGNDDDYRRFTLSRSRLVRLELRNLSADANLFLESASGRELESSRNSGNAGDAIARVLAPGTYYIRVDANAPGTVRYQLRYRTAAPPLPGTTRATAWNIGDLTTASNRTYRNRSGTVNRTNNDDDYRRFTFTRTSGIAIVLRDLTGDANLYLENASGGVIAASTRSGRAADVIVRSLAAGTYYLRVDANASGPIRYQLRYRRESVQGRTRGLAFVLGDLTNVTAFRSRSGTVNRTSNDDDYRRFTFSRTRGMSIVLNNLSANADLYVENAWGRTIYRSALTGSRSDVIYPTLRAGTYYIRVDAFDGGTIRYRLSYTTFEQTEVGDLTNQFGLRWYQGTVNTANDELDGFRFRLTRARTISLQLTNLSANANLRLIDSSGKQIAASVRTGTARDSITRTLNAGTYLVTVDAVDRGTIRYRLFFGTAPTIGSAASRQATDTAGTQPPPWREETVPAALSFQPDDRKPLGSPGGMLTA